MVSMDCVTGIIAGTWLEKVKRIQVDEGYHLWVYVCAWVWVCVCVCVCGGWLALRVSSFPNLHTRQKVYHIWPCLRIL